MDLGKIGRANLLWNESGRMRAGYSWLALPVSVGDRFVPPEILVQVRRPPGHPALLLKIEVRLGVPVCTEVRLLANPDGTEVRPRDLKTVHLDTLVEQAVALCSYGRDELGHITKSAPTPADRKNAERARRGKVRQAGPGRPRVSPDRLQQVADLYGRHAAGGRPIQVIAEVLGVDPRTAARYVEKCRSDEFRLLPPRERAGT